jgi:hypothetical protein
MLSYYHRKRGVYNMQTKFFRHLYFLSRSFTRRQHPCSRQDTRINRIDATDITPNIRRDSSQFSEYIKDRKTVNGEQIYISGSEFIPNVIFCNSQSQSHVKCIVYAGRRTNDLSRHARPPFFLSIYYTVVVGSLLLYSFTTRTPLTPQIFTHSTFFYFFFLFLSAAYVHNCTCQYFFG